MNVAFFVRHFTERGTEVAVYDYAKYNEEILGNKSYIICFTANTQQKMHFPTTIRASYNKFKSRFTIVEIDDIFEMKNVIQLYTLHFFYTLTYGGGNDIYQFNNKDLWNTCKTIKHCVFDTQYAESDFYISISHFLNKKYNTNTFVISHIVDLPECGENIRTQLNIPTDATVFGRYGGMDQFDISFVHQAISEYVNINKNVYFLFMNTQPFYIHPQIIYLNSTVDLLQKVKFINTCDAMIHARQMGESFGLAIAEFSCKNKPVITCNCGDTEHLLILGENAIVYNSKTELIDIFNRFKTILKSRDNWNSYSCYTPSNIMELFKTHIFDNYYNEQSASTIS